MNRMFFGLFVLASFTACDDTEELTCEVLDDPNFCWNIAVEEAYDCTSDAVTVGVISDNGRSCSLDSGATVTFTPALDPMQSVVDINELTIVVSNADGQCARLSERTFEGIRLSTASGTVSTDSNASDYTIECPDGTTYESKDALGLYSCSDSVFTSRIPGTFKSSGNGLFSFGISPKPDGIETSFVDCAFAETP